MDKIIKFSFFLALLVSLSTAAQNTATTSGNWDKCATWGYPSNITKGNDALSTKTLNPGISVIMNTNWNAQSLTLGAGSQLDFASSANGLDLNISGGTPQACIPPQYALGAATTTTSIVAGADISFSSIANSGVTISGTNINLIAGHLYKLTSALHMTGTSQVNRYFDYVWVNSAGTLISSTGRVVFENQNYPDAMTTGAVGYYKPTVNETVHVRFSSLAGIGSYVANRTFALVEEIPTTVQYMYALVGTGSSIPNNTDITFTGTTVSNGIAHTSGSANFTLTAGKTYKLSASLWVSGVVTPGTCAWVDASNNLLPGQVDRVVSNAGSVSDFPNVTAVAYYTPSANINVKFRTQNGLIGLTNSPIRTYATIEELSNSNYLMAVPSASQTLSNNLDLSFGTLITSNSISAASSTSVNLLAGHTYLLTGVASTTGQTAASGFVDYQWVDGSNTPLAGVKGQAVPVTTTNFDGWAQNMAVTIYTPPTNTTVKLRTTGYSGTAGDATTYSYITVKEFNN